MFSIRAPDVSDYGDCNALLSSVGTPLSPTRSRRERLASELALLALLIGKRLRSLVRSRKTGTKQIIHELCARANVNTFKQQSQLPRTSFILLHSIPLLAKTVTLKSSKRGCNSPGHVRDNVNLSSSAHIHCSFIEAVT